MGGPQVMLALVMAAVVTAGSSRGAVDDGICNVVTQYVVGEGKAAVGGSTLTYCASSAECRRTAEQVCCNGWTRDPDSKKLRCIKIDASNSASVGAVAIATDVGTDGDSTVSNTPKEKGGVRRPRGSAPLSEPNPVLKTIQSEADPPDGQSAPNAGLSVQNAAANLAAKGDGKSASGVDPPADVETSHLLSQPGGPPSSGAVGSHSGPNTASRGRPPGAAPAAGAEKHTPSGGVDNTPESSEGGSAKASGQPEGPPPVVVHPGSKNSSHSDVESKAPERKDNNDDHGVPIPTAGPAAPASSSAASVSTRLRPQMPVPTPAQGAQTTPSNLSPAGSRTSHTATPASPVATTPRNGESPASPVLQSVDNHPDVTKSQAPASPTAQSGDNHPSVSKSQAPASPTGQSGDNHPDVSKSQAPASPTGQSGDNHPDVPDVSKSQAPASPTGQSGDNHPDVSKSQAPASPTEQSADNDPSVSKTEAPASPTGQSGDNHPTVDNTRVNAPVNTDPNNSATGQVVKDSATLTLTGTDLEHGRHVDTITSTDSSQSTATTAIPTTADKITTANVPRSEQTSTSAPGAAAIHPAQKEISHNSVHTESSAGPATTGTTTTTASSQSIPHGGTTPASVAKPTDAPPAHHPNPQTNNNNLEYITVENKGSGANTPAGKSSVPAGQQSAANGTNATNVNGTNAANANGTNAANVNGTSATNCTVAGNASTCTGANCSLHQRNCTDNSSAAIPTVGLQTAPEAKPRAVPSGGSASKTASEVTISLLLVAAVAFVAALLYWRTRRRRRRYINCGTREPNLHFSNPVYDLESMMEQASLVKLQNAADVEEGGSSDPDHEGLSQRQ